ncbi:TPA: DUF4406 domain-containing protein [Enterobacter hormaechei subsp. xiangfangensis]|nr:DUF4406 domain-containing protein [Enterobacter hormaechei subsp. xiangfangensis]
MKIYIAGPMSGLPDFNRASFSHAHVFLGAKGHVVLNPALLPDGLTQAEYMDICLSMLRCADAIYMLEGWEHSAGARAENALAEKLEIEIIFQEDERAA